MKRHLSCWNRGPAALAALALALAVACGAMGRAVAGPGPQAATWRVACGEEPPPALTGRYSTGASGDMPPIDDLVALGRQIFFDAGLSASGKQSCATCHDPAHAWSPANRQPVQAGGPRLQDHGFRATPSLSYAHAPLPFDRQHVDLAERPDGSGAPAGGRTWDGRVDDARQQALMPLLDPHEMANRNLHEVVVRLRRAPYAQRFDALLSPPGTHILADEAGVISWLTTALMYFEQSAPDFHPFTSQYDDYLRGRDTLSPAALHGLKLFGDPDRGNCASCHPLNAVSAAVPYPRFTDFEFSALGVPRNPAIEANRRPRFHDLGLCGPLRHDLRHDPTLCGQFRAPTLRNVALRGSYFHNGVFHDLRTVLDFYATRDTQPARWYGRAPNGQPRRYNDLPPTFHANVKQGPPFQPWPDGRPRLSPADRDDLVAFLRTLTDGHVPPAQPMLMQPDEATAAATRLSCKAFKLAGL